MNRTTRARHVAAWIGMIGGGLGVIAGLVQATVGPRIPQWTGDKDAPVLLGLLTILLSAVGIWCAGGLRSQVAPSPGRRAIAVAGLVIPAGVCITTVGALWLIPGALLLVAGVTALVGEPEPVWHAVAAHWSHVLISALGAFELVMAASAGPAVTIAVGVVGGLALGAAPWVPDVRVRWTLLLVGTLPFAVLTWWALAGPLLALVAVLIAATHLRTGPPAVTRAASPHSGSATAPW